MSDLTQMYDDIKNDVDKLSKPIVPTNIKIGPGGLDKSPAALVWRNKAAKNAECLKDDCCKHFILDIYCKILSPTMDDENDPWVANHKGLVSQDVNNMLAAKGMTASQYLTSCYNATKAPFVEYLINSADVISQQYMEDQEAILKDAQEHDIDAGDPKQPTMDDDDVSKSIVDVKADTEYSTFIDKLQKKTINKIVDNISDIINDKKQENNMSFNPQPATESTVGVAMDYLQKEKWNESTEQKDFKDMLGESVREATLHQIDVVFEQENFTEYANRIRAGQGYVITESVKDAIQKKKEEKEARDKKKAEASDKLKKSRISIAIWGKKFDIPVKFETKENENVSTTQVKALDNFVSNVPEELKNDKKISDYVIKHNASEIGGTTVSDIHKYVTPKFICIKKSNIVRGVAVVCDYKLDKDHQLALIFDNEKFKKIASVDKEK